MASVVATVLVLLLSTAVLTESSKPKILCLHGEGDTGDNFKEWALSDLIYSLPEYEFVTVNAGYYEKNYLYEGGKGGYNWILNRIEGSSESDFSYYDSIQALLVLEENVVGVLGFSQGAAFLPLFLSQGPMFNFVVTFSGYPLRNTNQPLLDNIIDVPSLVWIGGKDTVVTLDKTIQFASVSFNREKTTMIIDGDGTHALPKSCDETFEKVVVFIRDQMRTFPTTIAPTTIAPTTVAPITVAPTTIAPTTAAPTTVAPTTTVPITTAPTTLAPVYFLHLTPSPTNVPTTTAPITISPRTSNPTTANPKSANPTSANPTTANPTTTTPTTTTPKTTTPKTTTPKTKIPTMPTPKTTTPTSAPPKTAPPKTAPPKTVPPSTAPPPKKASPNTASPTTLMMNNSTTFCGNGEVGSGICPVSTLCCSEYGWCGNSSYYCEKRKQSTSAPKPVSIPGITFCGNGTVGNGLCPDSSLCCSEFGWCGGSSYYCEKQKPLTLAPTTAQPTPAPINFMFCGDGTVGNGICLLTGMCCSEFGHCGNSSYYCKSKAPTNYTLAPTSAPITPTLTPTISAVPTIDYSMTFCGNGTVANGTCPDATYCCSDFGWCGTGVNYCPEQQERNEEIEKEANLGPCGEGVVGDGVCEESDECCSTFGWCGDSSEYCDNI